MMRCEKIGRATLYCGDSRELIASLEGVDGTITDPPYGVGYTGSATKDGGRDAGGYASFDDTRENIIKSIVPIVTDCVEKFGRLCMTPGPASMFLYPEPRAVGAIYYPAGANSGPWGFVCSQPLFYYGKDPYLANGLGRRANSFSAGSAAEKNGHPCPKPIDQMKWLVNRASLPGETVFDPFMGSGTTGVAAVTMDRNFIGCEIEPAYFDIACERIRKAQDQGDLFIECAAA
jgi:site-specific DNA-methyltransferase (adenine-specific)